MTTNKRKMNPPASIEGGKGGNKSVCVCVCVGGGLRSGG